MSDASDSFIGRYDWETISPSVAVVETVSEITGRDPLDLPTLNDIVDTDALDVLYTGDETDADSITISFAYAGYDVTVLGDGRIVVEPVDGHQ